MTRPGRLMRVADHRAPAAGSAAPWSRRSRMRRSRGPSGRSPGAAPTTTSTTRRRRPASWAATPRRSSSMPPPGRTSTAAPASRAWRCAATAIAVGELARGLRRARASISSLVSTNEVFDGRRTDGRGYRPDDRPAPPQRRTAPASWPASVAQAAFAQASGRRRAPAGPQLAIVRTAWLYGPPGNDFPAQDPGRRRAGPGRPASRSGSSADEVGSPTSSADLAEAIVELIGGRRDRRDMPPRQPRRGVAGRLGARGVSAGRAIGRHGRRAGLDLAARVDAATLGVLEPSLLPSGDRMRAVDGGPGRRRPAAPARRGRRGGLGPGRGRVAMTDLERPPSRLNGVRYGAAVRHADGRGSFRELWRASDYPAAHRGRAGGVVDGARFVQANLSTSAAGVLRGLHLPPPPARPLGRRDRAARSSPSSTSGRSSAAPRPAAVETRELGGRRVGRDPGRGGPRLPRPRAARARLPGDQRVRR